MKGLDFAQEGGIDILGGFRSSSYANGLDVDEVRGSSGDIFLATGENCIDESIVLQCNEVWKLQQLSAPDPNRGGSG